MTSTQPRIQRKRLYNATVQKRHRLLGAHVDPSLASKSKLNLPRALPVREGDVVRIMRGSFRGKEGKIVSVDSKHGTAVVEGITIEKVDEKKVPRPVHASNLMIVKMDDTDAWRRRKFEE
jgi:large subunit ribosomal protein L24